MEQDILFTATWIAYCTIHSYCSVQCAWALRAKQSSSSAHRMILQSNFTIFLLLRTDFWAEGREWKVPQNTPSLMALCWFYFWSCGGNYTWTSETHKLLLWENVRGGVGVMWEDVEERRWASSDFRTGHISCIGIPGGGKLGLQSGRRLVVQVYRSYV